MVPDSKARMDELEEEESFFAALKITPRKGKSACK